MFPRRGPPQADDSLLPVRVMGEANVFDFEIGLRLFPFRRRGRSSEGRRRAVRSLFDIAIECVILTHCDRMPRPRCAGALRQRLELFQFCSPHSVLVNFQNHPNRCVLNYSNSKSRAASCVQISRIVLRQLQRPGRSLARHRWLRPLRKMRRRRGPARYLR